MSQVIYIGSCSENGHLEPDSTKGEGDRPGLMRMAPETDTRGQG